MLTLVLWCFNMDTLCMYQCIYLCRYEGTGRSLSLKLIQQLRAQCATMGNNTKEAVKAANMGDSTSSSATGQ